ncbi:MAG: CcmD family protein [Vicingaceae bacterium]
MKIVLFIGALLFTVVAQAQEIAMADAMRENGKIYVVVAVLGVILLGLILYLISIDRKLKKLEEEKNRS